MVTILTFAFLLAVPGPRAHAAPAKAAGKAAPEAALSQAGDAVLVKVNGTPIMRSQFEEKIMHDYGRAVLDEMIERMLLLQEAKSRKIEASKAEVDERMGLFVQNRFGSQDAFSGFLQRSGLTADMVRDEIAQETTIEKLITQANDLTVTEVEVQTAFDRNKNLFGAPPKVRLRLMKVSKSEAEDVLAKLKKGASFASLAAEKSLPETKKLSPDGDLGFVPAGALSQEFDKKLDEAVFAMKVGETKAIHTPKGSFVAQVLEARAAQAADFNKLKTGLRSAVLNEKVKTAKPGFVQSLAKKAAIQYVNVDLPANK